MATTVRVRDEDKAALDTLQAKVVLATGRRLSLEDLLGRLIALAQEHEDELVLHDQAPRLTAAEVGRFLAGTSDWGVATSEEDIDEVLYGGDDAA